MSPTSIAIWLKPTARAFFASAIGGSSHPFSASDGALTAPTQSVPHAADLGSFSVGNARRSLSVADRLVGAQECASSDAVGRLLPQELTMRLPVVPRAWLHTGAGSPNGRTTCSSETPFNSIGLHDSRHLAAKMSLK